MTNMKVLLLDQEKYDPQNTTRWKLTEDTVEEAILKYCGKKTFQIQWEQDGFLTSTTISTYEDNMLLAEKIGDHVTKKIKEQLFK